MATTTNYGWTTPDDTALVKDGAAAIRSLGTSVDTTTKNLNPSTTLGDIEYRSSTANTNTRLAIGSTGNVLTVAGGVPSWAAPAATTPSFVGAMVFKTADQSIPNNTDTAVTFTQATDYLDTDGFHDPTSNSSRMTIPAGKGGKYLVFGNLLFDSSSSTKLQNSIFLNGSQFTTQILGGAGFNSSPITAIMTLAATDYVELFALQNSGGNLDLYGLNSGFTGARITSFGLQFLGA